MSPTTSLSVQPVTVEKIARSPLISRSSGYENSRGDQNGCSRDLTMPRRTTSGTSSGTPGGGRSRALCSRPKTAE
jgi:hypothetical protein